LNVVGEVWLVIGSKEPDGEDILTPLYVMCDINFEERTSLPAGANLYAGDRIRVGPNSKAVIMLPDGTEIALGPNTTLVVQPGPEPTFFQKSGNVLVRILKAVLPRETKTIFDTPQGVTGNEGTVFTSCVNQRIAYVNAPDLWLMNADGTDKELYIPAPIGRRIGRAVFSPDGEKVAYEVWWDEDADGQPELSDLWTADVDGANARPLLSAGELGDDTGKTGYVFKRRLLIGPSFSPDSGSVSFLRIQDMQVEGGYQRYREKEVRTVSASGAGDTMLWKTMQPIHWAYDSDVGRNTVWTPDNRIGFTRSGSQWGHFSTYVDASDTNRTTWPSSVWVRWAAERGLAPVRFDAVVDGERIDMLSGPFVGFGRLNPGRSGPDWTAHPEEWETPQMGGWYGPVETHEMPEGQHSVEITFSDGLQTITHLATNGVQVVKGSRGWVNRQGRWYLIGSRSGIWTIHPGGGEPSMLNEKWWVESLAWNETENAWFGDYENFVTRVASASAFDADGTFLGWMPYGTGTQNALGNWDATGTRLVAWAGDNGTGTVHVIDASAETVAELGSGSFPVFAPLYQSTINCFEGLVSVTDTNGMHKQLCGAGQSVSIDSLDNGGWPQTATSISGPYVTNVIPAWGSAVANGTNLTVAFQFNVPIDPDTITDRLVTGVSWPGRTPEDGAAFMMNWAGYATTLHDTNSASSFRCTVGDAVSAGIGAGGWNATKTEYRFTVTAPGFSRAAGNWCAFNLDLGGVESAGGTALPFNGDGTLVRFVDPVGPAGGEAWSPQGGGVTVPVGALADSVALEVEYDKYLPVGTGLPGGDWKQLGGVFTFTPSDQALNGNVTVGIPAEVECPGMSIWYHDGAAWSHVGGMHDPDTGLVSASVDHLGTFCVFYQEPPGVCLRLAKRAGTASAPTNEQVSFSLALENLGQSAASDVSISDALPTGLTCLPDTVSDGGTYHAGSRTITWNLGGLGPGSNRWVDFSATVDDTVPHGAAITNTAVADCAETAPTNSNAFVLRVGLSPGDAPRFGMGGPESTDWVNLSALGASYRRLTLSITAAEARDPGTINFAVFDAQVRNNQAAGLRPYGIVNCVPDGSWPTAAEFAWAFQVYVERYDGDGIDDMPGLIQPVRQWEIFDRFEPGSGAWSGCTVAMYADYLSLAHAAAHGANADVTVLNSAFEFIPDGTNYLVELLVERPAAADSLDAVSYHDTYEFTPYYFSETVWTAQYLQSRLFMDVLEALGLSGCEVWASKTDFGSTYEYWKGEGATPTQRDNAAYLARSYPYALARGIDHVIYSELEHDPAYPETKAWTVMVDAAGNRRMSFYVYRQMIELLEGFSDAEPLDFGNNNIGARFLVDDQPVWVLWQWYSGTSRVDLAVGPVAQCRVTDALPASFDNTSVTWSVTTGAVVSGVATITVTTDPVYVQPVGAVTPDIDGDGIPNGEDDDIDGDGMPNEYELEHGLNPFVDDAREDADGDGLPNLAESRAGTDPQDPDSRLACASLASGDAVEVAWQSVSGRVYRVNWSPGLRGAWSNAADGLIQAVDTQTVWHDTGPPRTAPFPTWNAGRFYRVTTAP